MLHVSVLPNLVHAPCVQDEAVQQCHDSKDGERDCGREGDFLCAKIEECGSDCAEEDGKFEPGEECAFGGEVYLWLDTHGNVDTCASLVRTL